MSITRNSATIPLKSMAMNELRDEITDELNSHDLDVVTDSLNDDECILIITSSPLVKTVTSLYRSSHRPLEIVVEVDYNEVKNTKDVLRITKPPQTDRDNISFHWLWLLPVFGGLIISLITLFEGFFASLYGSTTLSQFELIVTVTIMSTIFAILWIYGVPAVLQQLDIRRRKFDKHIVELISNKIQQLDEQQEDTPVRRCWSCFKELDPKISVCPSCGESQK